MYFPTYTFREKVADALVHAIGVLACIIGVSILMVMTALNGNNEAMIAGAIFGCGMLASFTMSAAYNIIEIKDWKAVLKRADHAAIYLMIAGAYTPIAAVVIGGEVGWSLLAFVWTLVEHLIDKTEFFGLFSGHEMVTIKRLLDGVVVLTCMLYVNFIQTTLHLHDVFSVALNIRRLTLKTARWLVHHDSSIWKCEAHVFGARCKQQ